MNKIKDYTSKILQLGEKHLKTDTTYLAKGGFWLTFTGILSAGISFLTVLAFANLLSPEDYGLYQYVLSTIGVLMVFNLDGINTAITRTVAQGHDNILKSALKIKIKWGLISSLASLGVGIFYLAKENQILGWSFILASLMIPFWENLGIYVNYLQGKKNFKSLSTYDLIIQLLVSVAMIISLLTTNNPLIILLAYMGFWTIGRLYFFLRTLKKFPPTGDYDPETIIYGKHLTLMTVFNTISSSIDKILLWHLLGPAQLAFYTFAIAIPLKVNGFTKIINRLAFPKLANKTLPEIKETLLPKIMLLVAPVTLASMIYIISAPFIFQTFFPQYIKSVPYTQLASLLIILQPFTLISSALTASAKKKELYFFNFLSPLIKTILLVILITQFQILGAILALVGSRTLDSITLIILLKLPNKLQTI